MISYWDKENKRITLYAGNRCKYGKSTKREKKNLRINHQTKSAWWAPSTKKMNHPNILFMLLHNKAATTVSSVRGPLAASASLFSFFLFFFFKWPAHSLLLIPLVSPRDLSLVYGFLHLPFFSRCWNFLSLRAHVSLHWITRLPLSATTPLCPGESSSFPSSRYFFPGLILGHLQATSLARTHKNWSPRRMRLSPCL